MIIWWSWEGRKRQHPPSPLSGFLFSCCTFTLRGDSLPLSATSAFFSTSAAAATRTERRENQPSPSTAPTASRRKARPSSRWVTPHAWAVLSVSGQERPRADGRASPSEALWYLRLCVTAVLLLQPATICACRSSKGNMSRWLIHGRYSVTVGRDLVNKSGSSALLRFEGNTNPHTSRSIPSSAPYLIKRQLL